MRSVRRFVKILAIAGLPPLLQVCPPNWVCVFVAEADSDENSFFLFKLLSCSTDGHDGEDGEMNF